MKPRINIFLAALSGGLLILCFPRFNLSWLTPIALALMFFVARKAKPKAAFLYGWLTGAVFFSGLCYWVGIYGVVPLAIMAVMVSLCFAGAFAGISFAARNIPWWGRLLVIPAIWAGIEILRSETGAYSFSYGTIGYAFHGFAPALGLASVIGVYGISYITAAIAAGLTEAAEAAISKNKPRAVFAAGVTISIFLISVSAGYVLNTDIAKGSGIPIKVALVQASIPQNQKWLSTKSADIMNKYEGLASRAGRLNPDLIIFPEAALPAYVSKDDELVIRLRSWAEESAAPILAGVPLLKAGEAYNTAALFDEKGRQTGEYAKITPVLFGEMIPFRSLSERIYPDFEQMGDISTGKTQTMLRLPGKEWFRFGTLICSESMYSRLALGIAGQDPDAIIVITNDGWFYSSNEAELHFGMTKFRAAETGRYIAQAANTGISAVISPAGSVSGALELNESGVSEAIVKARRGRTPFSAGGWLLTYIFIVIIAGASLIYELVKVCTKPQDASII